LQKDCQRRLSDPWKTARQRHLALFPAAFGRRGGAPVDPLGTTGPLFAARGLDFSVLAPDARINVCFGPSPSRRGTGGVKNKVDSPSRATLLFVHLHLPGEGAPAAP